MHDVAILEVTPSWTWNYETWKVPALSWCYEGWKIDITVVALNYGTEIETFNVTLYCDNSTIGKRTVTDLAPSKNVTITFVWHTSGVEPCNNYTISAEAKTVPGETNIENNIFIDSAIKMRMVGDSNGDGKVDYQDLYRLAYAYGAVYPQIRYYIDYDFNLDGKIDYKDLFFQAGNYGRACV